MAILLALTKAQLTVEITNIPWVQNQLKDWTWAQLEVLWEPGPDGEDQLVIRLPDGPPSSANPESRT